MVYDLGHSKGGIIRGKGVKGRGGSGREKVEGKEKWVK